MCDVEKTSYIIISYVPLMAPPDPQDMFLNKDNVSNVEAILKDAEEVENSADALAWTIDHEPVFIIKHAELIAKHIEFWSEEDPTSWFTVNWYYRSPKYAMVLMPNLEKSVERNKKNYKLLTGEEQPDDADYKIIFKPINFSSENSKTFNQVKHTLPKETRVGFASDLEADIYWLGDGAKFKIERNDDEYMKSLLEE